MRVIRGGCASIHEETFVMSRPYGLDDYVLLLLRSHGEYWIDGNHYLLNPGHAIIIAPGTHYRYCNPLGKYADDWIHFQFDDNETMPAGILCNTPFILDDLETCAILISQLLWEKAYTSPRYICSNINSLFSVLFNHLAAAFSSQENIEKTSPYLSKFKRLRLQIQSTISEEHSIKKHADELCISMSHFQHLYSEFFGISFQNDLIRMRINSAAILLQTTMLPIDQIAEACGYSSNVHFFRQFKQLKGTMPSKYRQAKHLPEDQK